jgi:hypothetical protein
MMTNAERKPASQNQPPSLQGRAAENLEFIRATMQRSTEFTAVPGYGGMLMGTTAVGAAIIAQMQTGGRLWLATWLTEALLAFLIGVFAMWQKSKASETSLNSLPGRKFAMGFVPPIVAGVILTGMLSYRGFFDLLPPVWLSLYGVAVVTGGAFSVRPIPTLGWIFIAAGAVAALAPAPFGNLLMGACFGVLHIVFGFVIARNYGG